MGYAAVASLSETIHLILNYHQDYTSPHFKNQIISLQKHSVFLRSFFEDDPDRVKYWEETIREVTDRAEEIIELLLSDSFLELIVGSSTSSKLRKEGYDYELHYDFRELDRVTEEMESVFYRVQGDPDEELMEIISRLRGGSSSELEVIAIVGVGGTGKTTLAKNAYDHPLIVEHFEIRAWSTISNDYSLQGTILELLHMDEGISDSEDELISSILTALRGRKYLIVLDDVESFGDFERRKILFPDDGNGSRIILTMRLQGGSSIASTHIHHMRLFDEDSSWKLFERTIFRGDPCPAKLESVGKMIARSYEWLPLSIMVVSGMLAAADQTESAWEEIFRSIKILYEDGLYSSLFQILSVCYAYLPHHLRPCFLYLGCFPEDHEIRVSKLIKLWVAEGFLNESECKSFEDTGEEHVVDLVRRNLVGLIGRKSNGRIKSIVVHDITREFCLRQAEEENIILRNFVDGEPDTVKLRSCRRVSTSTYDDDIFEGVYGSTIRTIILNVSDSELSGSTGWSVENVRLLRIFDLSNAYNYDLPEEVFDLFHLRYLAFHCGFSISEAISNLENLQTLIIRSREKVFEKFGELPEGILRMPQLRHLIVFPSKLPSPKGATYDLVNLQTLSGVVDFICSEEYYGMMPNLKKLAIYYSKNSGDVVEDYQLDNLIYLFKLEILKIEIMMHGSFVEEHKMRTRRAFQFPLTLRKLNLCGVQLPWVDMEIVASLPNLQVLKLRKNACIGETWETSEGGFYELTHLLIEECYLVHWITESSHFPSLKCLALHCCLRLLEIPTDIGEIPTLEIIELDDQESHSLLRSANRIQEDRPSWGYDFLQIRLV